LACAAIGKDTESSSTISITRRMIENHSRTPVNQAQTR
jgi:hypothetical protein